MEQSKMKYALKKKLRQGQEAVVTNFGDAFRDWLCDTFRDSFTVSTAAEFPGFAHLSSRTRVDYTRVILRNVEAGAPANELPYKRMGQLRVWAKGKP
jgi:hypothetical protein